MQNVKSDLYKEISAHKLNYEENEYNERRLQDFVVCCSAAKVNLLASASDDMIAEEIIHYADENHIKLPEMKEMTQLEAVVDYLKQVADENGYVAQQKLWLPVLPRQILLEQLDGYSMYEYRDQSWRDGQNRDFTLRTLIGLVDDPVNQAQYPLVMDVAEGGNHAILGNVSSGKSTLLQTYVYSLVNRYSPEHVNLYLIDFSSKRLAGFTSYPHVGGIIYEDEAEKAGKLFNMMGKELDRRKRLFRGGDYSQFVRANGYKEPAIIIIIDNYALFRERTNSSFDDFIMSLAKEGINNGIYMIITGNSFGMNEIPGRLGDNFHTIMTLQMNDRFGYTDALRTMHLDVLPEEDVQGTGGVSSVK